MNEKQIIRILDLHSVHHYENGGRIYADIRLYRHLEVKT